jgi:hypothetical protein
MTRTRTIHAITTAAALVVSANAAPAADFCRTRDRDCLIEAAQTYVHTLASGDVDSLRIAPNVWRVELGHQNIDGEAEMRANMSGQCANVVEVFHERWYVDELQGEAIVFYDLLADSTRGEECGPPTLPRELQARSWIAERFRVLDGLIHEVEPTLFIDAPGTSCTIPERRDQDFGPFGCGSNSRACAIETGNKYLDAVLSHDTSELPLAPDAWYLENCKPLGDNDLTIEALIQAPGQIVDLTHRRWFIDGEHAVAFYFVWTHPSGDPNTPKEEQQANFYAARLRVDDGRIKEIEVIYWPAQAAFEPGYDFPDDDGDGFSHVDDNCPYVANAGQEDRGGVNTAEPDGVGDACQCGDVTGNGIVNGQDGSAVSRHGIGAEPNPLFQVPGNCDVTGSGQCNGQDANAIRRAALGLETGLLFGPHCPNADLSVPCPDC